MRLSTPRAPQGRSRVGTLGLALAVAAVLVGGALAPAFSDEYKQRNRQQERDWRAHQAYQRAYPPSYRRAYPRYHYYAPPPVMYAPPPVVYAPLPSPGISLFFGFPIGPR
jgi:hypothetical protein